MAVTVADLAEHLGFPAPPTETEVLDRALGTAQAMITPHLLPDVPATPDQWHALDLAVLTCAQDLWRRKDSIGGAYTFGDGSDVGGFLPRDQLASVWPILTAAGLVRVAVA